MDRDATLQERCRVAVDAHAMAIRESKVAALRGEHQLLAFWNEIARACVAEFEECDAALRAGVEAFLGFAGLQTGNSDLYQLEA